MVSSSLSGLLGELTRCGLQLQVRNSQLRCWPPTALRPDLVQLLTSHKDELLAIMKGADALARPSVAANDAVGDWATYTAKEIDYLSSHTPRMRKLVHDAKTVFARWGPVDIVEHEVDRGAGP